MLINQKIFKLAFLNLFRNKRRSFSTGLAICVGFVGLNLLGAYIYRVKRALDTTSVYSALRGHIQIYKHESLVNYAIRPKAFSINNDEKIQIQKVLDLFPNEIDYIGQNLSGAGLLSNGVRSHPIIAYSYEPAVYAKSLSQPELMRWAKDWLSPSQLENIAIFNSNKEVISVTPKIAEIMGYGYPLAKNGTAQVAARSFDGDLNAINAELGAEHIVGLEFLEDVIILVPLIKMQELLGTENVESYSIYLKDRVSIVNMKEKLDRELSRLNFKLDTFFYNDEKINAMYVGTMGFLYVMGGFFIFLIGTAVSLTIINSLTMGIIERTKEIGTLRAVGFKQKDVAQVFIFESVILCSMAVVVGLVIALAIAVFINSLNIQFSPPAASGKVQFILGWNLNIALSMAVIVFALTLASSYLVMRTKSEVKLIDLLNDTGA